MSIKIVIGFYLVTVLRSFFLIAAFDFAPTPVMTLFNVGHWIDGCLSAFLVYGIWSLNNFARRVAIGFECFHLALYIVLSIANFTMKWPDFTGDPSGLEVQIFFIGLAILFMIAPSIYTLCVLIKRKAAFVKRTTPTTAS